MMTPFSDLGAFMGSPRAGLLALTLALGSCSCSSSFVATSFSLVLTVCLTVKAWLKLAYKFEGVNRRSKRKWCGAVDSSRWNENRNLICFVPPSINITIIIIVSLCYHYTDCSGNYLAIDSPIWSKYPSSALHRSQIGTLGGLYVCHRLHQAEWHAPGHLHRSLLLWLVLCNEGE